MGAILDELGSALLDEFGTSIDDELDAATVTQESFCWRNDDGSETTATWEASQNANITILSGSRRIRFTLNFTGDPAAITPQFEFRRQPNGGEFGPWTRIE